MAIELAAAQVGALSPNEITRHLGARFAILAAGDRTRLPKQRTLWATLEWSHRLLDDTEKVVFRRLAVFAGGFDLAAAQAVLADDAVSQPAVPAIVARLTDKSLVIAEPDERRGTRYKMLETLREFAMDQLEASGEADATRGRHAAYYIELVSRLDRETRDWDAIRWLPEYAGEEGNLRAALARLRFHDAHQALQLATWMSRYWELKGSRQEGRSWLQAIPRSEIADKRLLAAATFRSGRLAYWDGDYDAASAELSTSIELKRDLGDPIGLGQRLSLYAAVAQAKGDIESALQSAEESLRLAVEHNDVFLGAWAKLYMGWIVFFQGDVLRAEALFRESEGPLREARDYGGLYFTMAGLIVIAAERRDFELARRWAREFVHVIGDQMLYLDSPGSPFVLLVLAEAEGRYESAIRLWGATLRMERRGAPSFNLLRQRFESAAERAKTHVTADEFERLIVEGAAMSHKVLIAEALGEGDIPALADQQA